MKRDDVVGVAEMPLGTALGVGLVQCLAMIPGVSRSGATIMGALSLGVERRTAAEFSFFLAIPTMLGATTLELVKHRDDAHGRRERRRLRHRRGRLRRQLPRRAGRRPRLRPLHLAPRLRAVRLVPDRRRRGRARLADDALSLFHALLSARLFSELRGDLMRKKLILVPLLAVRQPGVRAAWRPQLPPRAHRSGSGRPRCATAAQAISDALLNIHVGDRQGRVEGRRADAGREAA